jgi:hypothetical protein
VLILSAVELPSRALPSGTPLGTLVSSCGSSRPSIFEPLDRCPFGPPTIALSFTYIKPSNPHCITFSTLPFALGPVTVLLQRHYAGLGRWGLEATVGCKLFQFFFLNLRRRRMELNTFFNEDDCGSNSHSTRRRRGRGRGRVGGRS